MSNWLVTGAQGFLGRYTVAKILVTQPEAQIVGVGRSPELRSSFPHKITTPDGNIPAPFPEGLSTPDETRYRYTSVDLTETASIKALLEQSRPEYIIHLATALRGDPRRHLLQSNIEATGSLFEAISTMRSFAPTVVLGSTGGVYGRLTSEDLPVGESRCPQPADEYAVTKLAAEHLAANAARRIGSRLVIPRIFNLVGAAQGERHVAGQIALKLSRLRRSGDTSLTIGPLDATRDFLDVRDTAAALVQLARNPQAVGVVNVASGRECSVGELLQTFLKRANREVSVQSVSGTPLDVPRHVGDITLLAGFGFKPVHTLDSSVDSIWSYYQNLWGS